MTNNIAMCDTYRAASANVSPRGYCTGAGGNQQPIDQAKCTQNGGTWYEVPAGGNPAGTLAATV